MMVEVGSLLLMLGGLLLVLLLVRAVVGRFIGLDIGSGRVLLALLFGALICAVFQTEVRWEGPGTSPWWQFALLSVFTLLFLLISELLVPQGSVPPVIGWGAALRRTWVQSQRSAQIMRILMRRGLNPLSPGTRRAFLAGSRRQARDLRLALEESGVTFVKLGQVLSTRTDLLPPVYTQELAQLQQQVAPAPWPDVKAVLEDELGGPLETVFGRFEPVPLASASVAQVHRAELRSGRPVVVKVQRPGIQEVLAQDLEIAERLGHTLQTRTDWGRDMGAAQLAQSFADALREELDFTLEAQNLADMAAALRTHPEGSRMLVPVVEPSLSSSRVLVMEELRGRTLSDPALLAALSAADRRMLARRIFDSLLTQITVNGVFHGDPHPGNIMVLEDGTLALVDCGSVGRIDQGIQTALQKLILSVEYADTQGFMDALFETLGRPEGLNEVPLRRALGQFMMTQLRSEGPVDIGLFNELIRVITAHGLQVPGELATALRALGVIQGTLALLDPDFDLIAEARQIASRQLQEEFQPENLRRTLEQELVTVLPMLRRLPRHVDQIAQSLEDGRLSVQVRMFADPRDRVVVWQIMNQVLLTLLGTVLGIIAVLLVTSDEGPALTATFTLLQVVGYAAGLLSAILIFRVLVVIFKRDAE